MPLIGGIADMSGQLHRDPDEPADIAMRVIADHARCSRSRSPTGNPERRPRVCHQTDPEAGFAVRAEHRLRNRSSTGSFRSLRTCSGHYPGLVSRLDHCRAIVKGEENISTSPSTGTEIFDWSPGNSDSPEVPADEAFAVRHLWISVRPQGDRRREGVHRRRRPVRRPDAAAETAFPLGAAGT